MTRVHWETMGTVVSLLTAARIEDAVIAEVRSALAKVDARFSLYRPDSELTRIAAGELRLEHASPELLDAYAAALEWRTLTDGAFTAHRPDGVIDLSGIVKAMAMRDAAEVLRAAGEENWMLGVGGDLLWSPDASDHTIGIVDPDDRRRLLTAVRLDASRLALATSGSAERGEHIWNLPDLAVSPFTQVTVAAGDIVTADVLATAIVAGGEQTLDLASAHWNIDVLAVARGGTIRATPGMREAIARAAAAA
ncbi:FAD:protein FMN transferase [Ruicaihuangia caeni]|uniref:FAD:protein FMN transferase n=1 Tax=Ruicaihuangia caeni TaxID=3042517 RepID=A0AAW6T8X0_9MICO|nr:FAD:protein FMN transferase [Klugiella sp. YN-L-19]MDI2098803.1 FAD:protein FMN transferase [Klugiella sp. YN-L-19]